MASCTKCGKWADMGRMLCEECRELRAEEAQEIDSLSFVDFGSPEQNELVNSLFKRMYQSMDYSIQTGDHHDVALLSDFVNILGRMYLRWAIMSKKNVPRLDREMSAIYSVKWLIQKTAQMEHSGSFSTLLGEVFTAFCNVLGKPFIFKENRDDNLGDTPQA